jgi:hypothetical protein
MEDLMGGTGMHDCRKQAAIKAGKVRASAVKRRAVYIHT